ncbi:FlgO family outer membrane protein [Gallaecimonas sp. GXIMD4217]|uniref:FlgO family outer membrane protein n=1 Tax=Gallaecimonas sp. GXIMD4217 TaxID=3131927 RepID=UPI00311AC1B3
MYRIVFASLLLAGCQLSTPESWMDSPQEQVQPQHGLSQFVGRLADELSASGRYISYRNPVAVTSFVELQNLESTDWLGNQLSESFMTAMHQRGYTVIDYKATGAIRVTPRGDFSFSRDHQKLKNNAPVDYVLSGTLLRQDDGVLVNVRLVGLKSQVVVATAEGYLPKALLGQVLNGRRAMQLDNNMLRRDDNDAAAILP